MALSATLALQGEAEASGLHLAPDSPLPQDPSTSPQATLCIERALHILIPPSAAAADGASFISEGRLAVTYQWEGLSFATPAVALTGTASATWQYTAALPMTVDGALLNMESEEAHLQLQVSSRLIGYPVHVEGTLLFVLLIYLHILYVIYKYVYVNTLCMWWYLSLISTAA